MPDVAQTAPRMAREYRPHSDLLVLMREAGAESVVQRFKTRDGRTVPPAFVRMDTAFAPSNPRLAHDPPPGSGSLPAATGPRPGPSPRRPLALPATLPANAFEHRTKPLVSGTGLGVRRQRAVASPWCVRMPPSASPPPLKKLFIGPYGVTVGVTRNSPVARLSNRCSMAAQSTVRLSGVRPLCRIGVPCRRVRAARTRRPAGVPPSWATRSAGRPSEKQPESRPTGPIARSVAPGSGASASGGVAPPQISAAASQPFRAGWVCRPRRRGRVERHVRERAASVGRRGRQPAFPGCAVRSETYLTGNV